VVTVPFLLVKASIFDRPSYHPPAVFLFLDFLGFSLLHILVARKVVDWARNRYKLGLLGQTHPWQVGAFAFRILVSALVTRNKSFTDQTFIHLHWL